MAEVNRPRIQCLKGDNNVRIAPSDQDMVLHGQAFACWRALYILIAKARSFTVHLIKEDPWFYAMRHIKVAAAR